VSRIQQALNKLNSLSAQLDAGNPRPARNFDDLKWAVFARLAGRFDYRRYPGPPDNALASDVIALIEQSADAECPLINRLDRDRLVAETFDEALRAGPLAPLLADADVTEVLVHGPGAVFARGTRGDLRPAGLGFRDETHLRVTLDRLVTFYGIYGRPGGDRGVRLDAHLPEGFHLSGVLPPPELGVPPTALFQRLG
jgi:hypothetical protein